MIAAILGLVALVLVALVVALAWADAITDAVRLDAWGAEAEAMRGSNG